MQKCATVPEVYCPRAGFYLLQFMCATRVLRHSEHDANFNVEIFHPAESNALDTVSGIDMTTCQMKDSSTEGTARQSVGGIKKLSMNESPVCGTRAIPTSLNNTEISSQGSHCVQNALSAT